MLTMDGERLVLYNLESKRCRNLLISDLPSSFIAQVYVGSLGQIDVTGTATSSRTGKMANFELTKQTMQKVTLMQERPEHYVF